MTLILLDHAKSLSYCRRTFLISIHYRNKKAEALQKIGFGTVVSHSKDGVLSGTGVLWTLSDKNNNSTKVLENKISTQNSEIHVDVSKLVKGAYFVIISDENNSKTTKTVLIK